MYKSISCLLFALLLGSSMTNVSNAKQNQSSGVYGQVFFDNNAPTPEGPQSFWMPWCDVVVEDAMSHQIIKTFRSNNLGKFKLGLRPGKYVVYPVKEGYTDNWITDKTSVIVWTGCYSEARASFNNGF